MCLTKYIKCLVCTIFPEAISSVLGVRGKIPITPNTWNPPNKRLPKLNCDTLSWRYTRVFLNQLTQQPVSYPRHLEHSVCYIMCEMWHSRPTHLFHCGVITSPHVCTPKITPPLLSKVWWYLNIYGGSSAPQQPNSQALTVSLYPQGSH